MNIKEVCSHILAIALLLSSANGFTKQVAIQDQQTYEGILGDKDQYSFQIKPNQAISISIAQINADVKVLLEEMVNGEKVEVYQLSTSADTWLNELLYITTDDCSNCVLTVLPQEKIDQSGKYQLNYELRQSIDPIEKQIMYWATKAGVAWQSALSDSATFNEHVYNASMFYQKATEQSESKRYTQLNIRHLFHASQLEKLRNNSTAQEKFLTQILQYEQIDSAPIYLRSEYALAILALAEWRLDDSISRLDQVRAKAEDQADIKMAAASDSILAYIYAQKRLYKKALALKIRALKIFEKQGDWRRIISAKLSIGNIHKGLGSNKLAIDFYHQALSLANYNHATEYIVESHTELAILHRVLGEFSLAGTYIEKALMKVNTLPPDLGFKLLAGAANQQKARLLMDLGQFEYAADIFTQAFSHYQSAKSLTDMINIDYYQSIIHIQLENYEQAQKHAVKVLEHDKKTGVKFDIGMAYQRLAQIAVGLEKFSEAMELQQRALEYLSDIEDIELQGKLFAQAGEIAFHNRLNNQGLMYFSKSKDAHNNKELHASLDTDYKYAKVQAMYGDKKIALKTLIDTAKKVEATQHSIRRPDQRRTFLAIHQKITNLHLHLQHKMGESPANMLMTAERFRSQTLKVIDQKISEESEPNSDLMIRHRELNTKLQNQMYSYKKLSDPAQRQVIIKNTREIASQLQQLSVENALPKSINDSVTKKAYDLSLDLEVLQQNLPHDTLILFFDTADPRSHLWAISQSSLVHYSLPPQSSIKQIVNKSLSILEVAKSKKRGPKNQFNSLQELSQTLFQKVDIAWHEYQHIVVVPDGPLHTVPFSALSSHHSPLPLVETHSISYVPSLTIYQQLSHLQANIDSSDKVLLMGDPTMREQIGSTQTNLGFQSTQLHYTEYEAEAVASMLSNQSTLLLKENATKDAFLKQDITNYDLIHFATHGVSHTYAPSLAGLVMSNVDTTNNLLLASEVSKLDIPAKLVILSGCETAKGRLIDGEGLMGLSRAFFEAGTKTVVASLWSVQDKATAELMKHFYQQMLSHNKKPREALQSAKLAIKHFRKKNGHKPWQSPYYWAGFVLQGAS